MLSWPASAGCCVEFSCSVLWSKANFIHNIVRMSGNVCKISNLTSLNCFRKFFSISMLVNPVVGFGSVYICSFDLHRPSEELAVPCIQLAQSGCRVPVMVHCVQNDVKENAFINLEFEFTFYIAL